MCPSSRSSSPARSFCVSSGLNHIPLASLRCVSVIYRRMHTHKHTHTHRRTLAALHTHTHTLWQILPSAKKSINKCIVSSLSAVGISLSKLSEKAVECEIEFRTVRCVRGHKMSVCFAYLFILQQHSVACFFFFCKREGQLNTWRCCRCKFKGRVLGSGVLALVSGSHTWFIREVNEALKWNCAVTVSPVSFSSHQSPGCREPGRLLFWQSPSLF